MVDNTITWWPSPAKINLFLHVCGRYPNGYHELQTLFQILDYCDQVGIAINQSGVITLEPSIEGLAFEDNLLVRAAQALQNFRASTTLGVHLALNKVIPIGGGLGGGSSNAATVLLVLNRLWQCNLPMSTLAELALPLGADVPVFVNGHSAFAQGVGEQLVNTNIPPCYYLVATPHEHISTASVFTHTDLPRNTPKISFNQYAFSKTQNDCEKLVCKSHPKVANLLQWLLHYAPSRMTGTGASVFATFSDAITAKKVQKMLPENIQSFVAKGLNVSPLQTALHTLGNN